MSYNVSTIEIIASEGFAMPRTLWRELSLGKEAKPELAPEDSFLDPNWPQRECEDIRGILFVRRISWCGEWSGHTWDTFKELLAKFLGSADLVVTWEGGDSVAGIRLLNGKVTEHKVIQALGEEMLP